MTNEIKLFEEKNPQLPAFMQEDVVDNDDLGQFIVPPRLKVVQSMSAELKKTFDEGDVIAMPQNIVVAKYDKKAEAGAPFRFVPLFFYAEWCAWNPLQMKGTLPAIRERTQDPDDPLVAKCRNQKLWHEPCPENAEYSIRNVEHLNFIIMLLDGELAGTPIIQSFSRAEHRAGTNFCALLRMRKAPRYGCIFEGQVKHRENPKGNWFGVDIKNPEDGGWVTDQNLYQHLKGLHDEFKAAHDSRQIQVDYEDAEESPGDAGEF